jgi:hypothetical protein
VYTVVAATRDVREQKTSASAGLQKDIAHFADGAVPDFLIDPIRRWVGEVREQAAERVAFAQQALREVDHTR